MRNFILIYKSAKDIVEIRDIYFDDLKSALIAADEIEGIGFPSRILGANEKSVMEIKAHMESKVSKLKQAAPTPAPEPIKYKYGMDEDQMAQLNEIEKLALSIFSISDTDSAIEILSDSLHGKIEALMEDIVN